LKVGDWIVFVCCLDAVFSGTILSWQKKSFQLSTSSFVFSVFGCLLFKKMMEASGIHVFQSVPITAPRNCDSPGKPLGILRHHETWS